VVVARFGRPPARHGGGYGVEPLRQPGAGGRAHPRVHPPFTILTPPLNPLHIPPQVTHPPLQQPQHPPRSHQPPPLSSPILPLQQHDGRGAGWWGEASEGGVRGRWA